SRARDVGRHHRAADSLHRALEAVRLPPRGRPHAPRGAVRPDPVGGAALVHRRQTGGGAAAENRRHTQEEHERALHGGGRQILPSTAGRRAPVAATTLAGFPWMVSTAKSANATA